jgi:hypothetical protein
LLYAAKPIVVHVNPTRRRVLFVGAAGAVALVAARWLAPGESLPPAAAGLSADGVDVVRALVPAMLDGALPADPDARKTAIEDTVGAVSTAIEGLPPLTRDELGTLFALLAFAPLRVAFAGVGASWQSARVEDVQAFLGRLRASRWAVKRAAYDALHQLVFAAWYANPRAWPAIGYPGPPALA